MATEPGADLQSPEVDTRAILSLVGGFLVFAAVSVVGLGVYYRHAHVRRTVPPREFAQPRLETRNRQDLGALLKTQRTGSEDYAWVDRDRGWVRIPVARAMQIIAERGAAAYNPAEPPKPAPTPTPSPSPPLATAPTPPPAPPGGSP